ncbi:hypothetical protein EVAR_38479_1 [Eumeta japonica]|uniref:Uncharacterized protein n=1 Tax=Eumeta variegata TaxID=151549 RepID=A0A4C1WMU4_EUMVA|nr:hypothetical protein EVAR_38479_1 [Eumeta japonica]
MKVKIYQLRFQRCATLASAGGGALVSAVTARLKDLASQLENLKKHCDGRDVPLCDTINTHSLELLIKFDTILNEHDLLELHSLGVDNLTSAIASAKTEFASVPAVIRKQTAEVRSDILQDVENRRQETHKLAHILSDIVRHLTVSLRTAARKFESVLQRLQLYDNWRWSIMLGCNIMCCIVMLLMISGLTCGCGDTKIHAMRTLKVEFESGKQRIKIKCRVGRLVETSSQKIGGNVKKLIFEHEQMKVRCIKRELSFLSAAYTISFMTNFIPQSNCEVGAANVNAASEACARRIFFALFGAVWGTSRCSDR